MCDPQVWQVIGQYIVLPIVGCAAIAAVFICAFRA
jgi:hypothetical protein